MIQGFNLGVVKNYPQQEFITNLVKNTITEYKSTEYKTTWG